MAFTRSHHRNVATPNNFDILRDREHDEFARYVARACWDHTGGSLPYCKVFPSENRAGSYLKT
jgi:hypothetical protein